ncbi:MAG: bifunctional phosphoribosylaminoimidazolecarboxamide formyltransferase/inosine monophosphate cyclohydrolase [Treponema sp.]|jgi:phosphoribosylaminoimidazolecarboxamide formyltransferase/IMP cyclohydrolase|nr:bifunctional phosphoribosylaminoimidazolecarboxamide formyltransferase/inosine monophosphate cyclohydrolase [Treponema sp.]
MGKRALISVFNKDGVGELAAYLAGAGWEIVSTGGTARYLVERGVPVTDVSAVTGFPECLDGRVKTLHPAIHAGLLARRDLGDHIETLERQGIGLIDLVCVNLYPFFEKVREKSAAATGKKNNEIAEIIEFIDIGGPSMLRSAAKNYRDVIALTDSADYGEVVAGLKAGLVPEGLRRHLAGKVFDLTGAYDAAIARCLLDGEDEYPAYWPLSLKKAQDLRYGENGHQSAALYLHTDRPGALGGMEQLHGKELGYNNIRDLDLAWKAACAFGLPADGQPPLGEGDIRALGILDSAPAGGGDASNGGADGGGASGGAGRRVCCVAVKHNSPCGIALGRGPLEAYEKTYACDPGSIFGGIVAVNAKLDAATAEKLGKLFLEIVAAPDFEDEALAVLKRKKNLRIMRARRAPRETREYCAVDGGLLVQETDRKLFEKWEIVTRARPAAADVRDMIFGMRAVSFVKSNAILVVKDEAAAGIGGGQVNRIWPARQALERAAKVAANGAGSGGAGDAGASVGGVFAGGTARVLASDAFFPFADVVEAAAAAGIKAIIQPGGSVNDRLSIEACDRHGIAMVFTGTRHFKH